MANKNIGDRVVDQLLNVRKNVKTYLAKEYKTNAFKPTVSKETNDSMTPQQWGELVSTYGQENVEGYRKRMGMV